MSSKYPYKTYLHEAFHNWYNYGVLTLFGGLALIDGLGNFQHFLGWLFVGAAVEVCFLYMLSTNPRYQRVVDSELEDEKELQVFALRNALWPHIEPPIRDRYLELEQLSARLRGDTVSLSKLKDPLLKENLRKVSVLLASYLKLAMAVTRYHNYLAGVDPARIAADVARLEKELAGATDERVKDVKQKNVDVLKKRAEKIDKAKANVQYLDAQMGTIADTMRLVVDQAITLSDPKGMGVQIDSLLETLQDTDLVAAEMDSLEELEQGLDPVIHLPQQKE